MNKSENQPQVRAIKIFKQQGGILKSSEAIRLGIHPRTLYELRDSGKIETLSRGLYKLAQAASLEEPDWITVAARVKLAVIGLVSALYYHKIGTQIPHQVSILLPKGTRKPNLDYPPTLFFWVSKRTHVLGVEEIKMNKILLHVTDLEKTIVDCFKFRNRIGMDIALEALKNWHKHKNKNLKRLIEYARICRMEKVMRPYLEILQ